MKFNYDKAWRKLVPETQLKAFNYITNSGKAGARRGKVYQFCVKACSPGASWKHEDPDTKKITRYYYNGAVSLNDISRHFDDHSSTNYRPRFVELKKMGMLEKVATRTDPFTGLPNEYWKPSKLVIPLPLDRPSPKKTIVKLLIDLREMADELDPDDEWTERLMEQLYSKDANYFVPQEEED